MSPDSGSAAAWLEHILSAAVLGRPLAVPPDDLWPAIAELAESQDLGGRLRAALAGGGAACPPALAKRWRELDYRDRARALLLRQSLSQALDSLAAVDVPVILLKGAALCATVLGDWALRPMGDLDLLIPEDTLPRAIFALKGIGYEMVLGHDELVERAGGPDLEALRTFHGQVTLRRADRPLDLIDLHWHLIDRPSYRHRMDMRPLWESARAVTVDGRVALVLCPEDMVIHLAAHPLIHHPESPPGALRWRQDLAEYLFAHSGIQWTALMARARAMRLLWALQAILPRVPAWAGIPRDALDALALALPDSAEQDARRWATERRPGPGRQLVDQLLHLPRWGLRLTYLRAKLLPSPIYLRRRHDAPDARGLGLGALYLRRWERGLHRLSGRHRR